MILKEMTCSLYELFFKTDIQTAVIETQPPKIKNSNYRTEANNIKKKIR